jgi:hypothetical protein
MIGDGKPLFLVREQLTDCTYISIGAFYIRAYIAKTHAQS